MEYYEKIIKDYFIIKMSYECKYWSNLVKNVNKNYVDNCINKCISYDPTGYEIKEVCIIKCIYLLK